jgi:hypothetical protein
MAVLVCTHCGKEHDERTKFCPTTGKGLERTEPLAETRPEDAPPTIAEGTPVLPPAPSDATGRATRLMFLPKGFKLPGQSEPAGGALPAPESSAAANSNRTMLAHVLPQRPPGSEAPPAPSLRPQGNLPAAAPAPPRPTIPGAPARPSTTMPAAPPRPSTTIPAAESPPPPASIGMPAVAPGRPALPGATAPMPRPAVNPVGGVPSPWSPPPAGENDATMMDMRAPSPEELARARPAAPSIDMDATMRASAVRPVQPDDGATPRMPQPPGGPLRPSGRKHSLPSWAISPSESASDPFPPEQSAAYASASSTAGFLRLLQRTGKFYVANIGPLLLIAALVLGPVSIVTSSLMAGLGAHSPGPATLVLGFLVSLLVMGTAWPLTTGTMTLAVLDRLHGGDMDPKRHWRFTFRRLGPLVTALVPAAFITAIGYFLFVIPGLIASLFLALVPTLVLLEGRQGADALKRSATMMKEALGPAVGIMLIFVVLSLAVRKLVTTIVPGTGFLDLVAADLAFIALSPLPMIALSIVYLDLRRSHEGVSPETLRHDIDALGL